MTCIVCIDSIVGVICTDYIIYTSTICCSISVDIIRLWSARVGASSYILQVNVHQLHESEVAAPDAGDVRGWVQVTYRIIPPFQF